jgi:hypothetical protein
LLPNAEYDFGRPSLLALLLLLLLGGAGMGCCCGGIVEEDDWDVDEDDDVEEDMEAADDEEAGRGFNDEAGLDEPRPPLAPPDGHPPPRVDDWVPSLREDDDPRSLLSGVELDDD